MTTLNVYINITETDIVLVETLFNQFASTYNNVIVKAFTHDLQMHEIFHYLCYPTTVRSVPSKAQIMAQGLKFDYTHTHSNIPFVFTKRVVESDVMFVGRDPRPFMAMYAVHNKAFPAQFRYYRGNDLCNFATDLSVLPQPPDSDARDLAVSYLCWYLMNGSILPQYANEPRFVKFSADASKQLDLLAAAYGERTYIDLVYCRMGTSVDILPIEVAEPMKQFAFYHMLKYFIRYFGASYAESRRALVKQLPWWYPYACAPKVIAPVEHELCADKCPHPFVQYSGVYQLQHQLVPGFLAQESGVCHPVKRPFPWFMLTWAKLTSDPQTPMIRINNAPYNCLIQMPEDEFLRTIDLSK